MSKIQLIVLKNAGNLVLTSLIQQKSTDFLMDKLKLLWEEL